MIRIVESCFFSFLISSRIWCSFAVIHTLSSIKNRSKSDSLIICSIYSSSSVKSSKPGESKKVKNQLSVCTLCWIISVVVPGISVTIARNCPINLLKRVDFHTFVAHTSQIFILLFLKVKIYKQQYIYFLIKSNNGFYSLRIYWHYRYNNYIIRTK
jgi:hypothetical protein